MFVEVNKMLRRRRKLEPRILMSKIMKIDHSHKFNEFFEASTDQRKIDFLVLHHVEADSADHAIEQFKFHQVSAHFLIDELGKIFQLVHENDVAYHAGVSFWNGVDGLNKSSIGIEFVNSQPFAKKFSQPQMNAGLELCRHLIAKYQIKAQNVVGHSDIAYSRETGFLDRKQDPSHLFDWQFLGQNGVGIFPQIAAANSDQTLFKFGDANLAILVIKQNLKKFGYRIINLNHDFDQEMQALAQVFNRRFLGKDDNSWQKLSQNFLDELI